MRGKPYARIPASCIARITPAHAGKTRPPHPRGKCSADHPRACGENLLCLLYAVEPSGSPPRMRGKRGLLRCCAVSPRITPAHAGKTGYIQTLLPCGADHPRACGENLVGHRGMVAKSGSPPRMRGKRPPPEQLRQQTRITPAHAGKTRADSVILCLHPDHPRACGENEEPQIPQLPNVGSPPRMRGKQPPKQDTARASRITPAHAGKTASARLFSAAATDHPRACGENRSVVKPPCFTPGSPPRMRGKRAAAAVRLVGERITPAHAGKTGCSTRQAGKSTDHPRACGENFSNSDPTSYAFGSPPRMRGKPWGAYPQGLGVRITPAHAGKTRHREPNLQPDADHPRACGENLTAALTLYLPDGSPPRMRGKPRSVPVKIQPHRITPAHAGKTDAGDSKGTGNADHPRACGENVLMMANRRQVYGSPPRMRGKRIFVKRLPMSRRITPAHAGKTISLFCMWLVITDHPRACGENCGNHCRKGNKYGSPPRMRGKQYTKIPAL